MLELSENKRSAMLFAVSAPRAQDHFATSFIVKFRFERYAVAEIFKDVLNLELYSQHRQ